MDYNKTIQFCPRPTSPCGRACPSGSRKCSSSWQDMDLYNELLNKDWFMTLLDLEDYIATKDRMFADYEDQEKWKRMMVVNIAKAGFFSSDRTIAEYNRDIWKLK